MTRTLQIRNGDVVLSRASGRLTTIENRDKARQSLRRILELDLPEGANIRVVVGTVPQNQFALSSAIQRNIRVAFDELVRAQRGQQLSERTQEEQLATIARMFVIPARFNGQTSKTSYAFRVDAVTVAGQSVTLGSEIAT